MVQLYNSNWTEFFSTREVNGVGHMVFTFHNFFYNEIWTFIDLLCVCKCRYYMFQNLEVWKDNPCFVCQIWGTFKNWGNYRQHKNRLIRLDSTEDVWACLGLEERLRQAAVGVLNVGSIVP